MTKFFEPISASATHIYHSALELCPVSSAVRKLYYNRYNRIAHLPRVVVGTPNSWNPTISISSRDRDYGFCTWSPCGRFIAAQREKVIEIRGQLTFELVAVLEPTETTLRLTGPLAYSPDGRSLACTSDASIIVWDIQTGGIAQEIECRTNNTSMLWSPDGREIVTTGSREAACMDTYDVTLGGTSSARKIPLSDVIHFWTHGKSCRVATVRNSSGTAFIDTFEVQDPPLKVHCFSIFHGFPSPPNISFSPETCHVSVETGRVLRIFGNGNSRPLLNREGRFLSYCFSSEGGLFAASDEDCVRTWKYDGCNRHCYISWKIFRPQDCLNSSVQFSPTPSSILVHSKSFVYLGNIQDLPSALDADRQQHYVAFHRSANYIVTARKSQRKFTIINVQSQTPPESIDLHGPVDGLAVTGSVVLVVCKGEVFAWPLTKQEAAKDRDPIQGLKLSCPQSHPKCKVQGQVGVIEYDENTLLVFHTGTGEVLQPTQTPQFSGDPPDLFGRVHRGRDYSHLHNLPQLNASPEDVWQTSETTLQEGWVKDPEGRHRLWIPVEWRSIWDLADWCHDIKIQFSLLRNQPIIVKF